MQIKKTELNKLILDNISKEKNKEVNSKKIMNILRKNPVYQSSTFEVITNKNIIEPPTVEKNSNVIITSSGKKTIEETIEKTYGGTIEKKFIISTTKNNSDILDNKSSNFKQNNSPNEKQYSGMNTEKNYYIIPDKNTFNSNSSGKFSNEKPSSSEKKSSNEKKYNTNSERLIYNSQSNRNPNNYSFNYSYNYQLYNSSNPFSTPYNNQTYNNQSFNSHSYSNSNPAQFYNNQTENLNNKIYNIKTYNNNTAASQNYYGNNYNLMNLYDKNDKKITGPIRKIIPVRNVDKELLFNQIKKQGLLDIKDSQTYEIQNETRYIKEGSKFARKNKSVGQVIVNSRSKENLREKKKKDKSNSLTEKTLSYSFINEKKKNMRKKKGKISNLFGVLLKNNDIEEDKIITKGMRNEKGGVVDFTYSSLNKSHSYTFMKFSSNIQYSEKKKKEAAKIIQKWWRKLVFIFNKYNNLIVYIQSHIRGYLLRKKFYKILNERKKIYDKISKLNTIKSKSKTNSNIINTNKKIEKYYEIDEKHYTYNYNYNIKTNKESIKRETKKEDLIEIQLPKKQGKKEDLIEIEVEEIDNELEDYLYFRNLYNFVIIRMIEKKLINRYYDFLLSLKLNNDYNKDNNENIDYDTIINYRKVILKKIRNKREFKSQDLLRNKFNKWRNQIYKEKIQDKENEKEDT